MARPIRETPILYGKDAQHFVAEMKRVEAISPEVRMANREKLRKECDEIRKELNINYKY